MKVVQPTSGSFHAVSGKTVYIPIIIPETPCLAIAFVLTFIASILFFVAIGTTTWKSERISMLHDGWTNYTYSFDFGVRRVHVEYCQIDTVNDILHKPDNCGGEDVMYSTCDMSNEFCVGAPAHNLTFFGAAVGLMGFLCILSIAAQFVRRYLHFAWHLPVSILSPFAVMATSLSVDKVQLSPTVLRALNAGFQRGSATTSLNCAIVAVLFVWIALLLMLLDVCWQKRNDRKQSPLRRSVATSNGPQNGGVHERSDDYAENAPHPAAQRTFSGPGRAGGV